MTSALAVDGRRGPDLPSEFRVPQRPQPEEPDELKSPLPPGWSDATRPLRDAARQLEKLFGDK
jgi:penicillin-binding protein 1A